ncbi:hypothetical protein UlMin_013078 [Ulmus minor]
MNAIPVAPVDFIEEHINESDSDTNLDDDNDAPEYYQPISGDDDDEDSDRISDSVDEHRHENGSRNDAGECRSHRETNGFYAENGVSSLRLDDDAEINRSRSEDEEGEEEVGSDSAVVRAFTEDENRRNAPLTPENATRVMEAMRGISFGGVAPDWAERVPENNWIDHLRTLRQPPQA